MKKFIAILIILLVLLGAGFTTYKVIDNKNKADLEQTIIDNIPTQEIPDGAIIPETELEAEGFFEENEDMISGSIGKDDKFIVGAKHEDYVYYSQVDSRWKNHMYSSTGNKSQTIGNSGCGPTCAAMIVSTIKGTIIPPDMGDLFVRYGYRHATQGTYHSAFSWVGRYFEIDCDRVYNTDDMVKKLKEGRMAVVGCRKGLFTGSGHFIVIVGIKGDTLEVYDPYLYNGKFSTAERKKANVKVQGTSAFVTVANFKKYANAISWFCYETDFDTNNDDKEPVTPTPTPETKSYTMYVNAKEGLRVRTGPSTSYKKLRTLPYGTKVTVYEDKSNWSRIGTDEWVCSDYLSSTKPNTFKSYTTYVNATKGLNIRKGPGTNYSKVGLYKHQTKITILEEDGNWGRTDKGWVCLDYTSTKKPSNPSSNNTNTSKYILGRYEVEATKGLNVRSGPGTNYSVKKVYKDGTIFDTYEIKKNWARTPSGWVCLDYCRLIYKY